MENKVKRKWTGLLVDPNFQFRFVFYFAASGSAVLLMLFVFLSNRVSHLATSMLDSTIPSKDFEAVLIGLLNDIILVSAVGLIANLIIATILAIYLTHRISGPAKVIEGYLNDLAADNFDSHRSLRKDDDLQAIMAAAQKLANHLKTRRV